MKIRHHLEYELIVIGDGLTMREQPKRVFGFLWLVDKSGTFF